MGQNLSNTVHGDTQCTPYFNKCGPVLMNKMAWYNVKACSLASNEARMPLAANTHNGVIKWKHFPHYWPFVQGIHQSPVNFPHKVQRHGISMFLWSALWINGWINNHEAGELGCHCPHYDVIIMARRIAGRTAYQCPTQYKITLSHEYQVLQPCHHGLSCLHMGLREITYTTGISWSGSDDHQSTFLIAPINMVMCTLIWKIQISGWICI